MINNGDKYINNRKPAIDSSTLSMLNAEAKESSKISERIIVITSFVCERKRFIGLYNLL